MNLVQQLELKLFIDKLEKIKDPYYRTCLYILKVWFPAYYTRTGRSSNLEDMLKVLSLLEKNKNKEWYINFIEDFLSKTNEYYVKTQKSFYLSPHKFLNDVLSGQWKRHEERFKRYYKEYNMEEDLLD